MESPVVQTRLSDAHIEQIVSTYRERTEQERYSRRVPMQEIIDNDCYLHISRYFSTAKSEMEIDLKAVRADLETIELKINRAKKLHNVFLIELGLSPLP